MPGPVCAESLDQALAQAYESNPALLAARTELRRADEQVAIANGAWRPSAGVTAGGGYIKSLEEQQDQAASQTQFSTTDGPAAVLQLRARQPVYNFYNGPRVRQAAEAMQAQRARLIDVEQDVLLRAATAYLDMVRAQEALRFSVNYEQSLRRSLALAQRRFDMGLVRRSAVAEADSRLAAAVADRIRAEGGLVLARDTYRQVIGSEPQNTSMPTMPPDLPTSVEEVLVGAASAPSVQAAEFAERAAAEGVDFSVGQKLPDFYLQAQLDARQAAILGLMDLPLYSGIQDAQTRAAKELVRQRRYEMEAQRRETRRAALAAWQNLQTARGTLDAFQAQSKASDLAVEGIEREYALGERVFSDLLNNQLEGFRARLSTLGAEEQLRLAAYQVLAAMGRFTARTLRLDAAIYDVEEHYDEVRGQWWGTGADLD